MKQLLLIFFILIPLTLSAQVYKISPDDTGRKTSYLLMRDGTVLRGRVLREDSTIISVKLRKGDMSFVEADQVRRITEHRPDLPEGTTNEFDYGITRFWSVGGSFATPFPFPGDDNDNEYAVRYRAEQPKLFTKFNATITPGFGLAVQGTYQRQQRNDFFVTRYALWTMQGLASFGSSQRNVTVGYGIAMPSRGNTYVGYQPPCSSVPPRIYYYGISNRHFLTLGIMQKVSRTLTLLSDNAVNLGDDYNPVVNQRATVSFVLRLDRPRV